MTSLNDGDAGLMDVIRLGPAVIPALRAILFAREPSGLHQARCRAVEGLAALKAFDILGEFLRDRRLVGDPAERLGDDAVVSAAARTIARLHEEWVYDLLADIAKCRHLGGVLAGLGSFHRPESIPLFVAALGEDEVRLTARAVLHQFGKAARPHLLAAILDRGEGRQRDSESHLRKRRSAFSLLLDAGVARSDWPQLRPLMDDDDHQLVLLACRVCLDVGDREDREHLVARLRTLKISADWIERTTIEKFSEMLKRS